MSWTIAGACVLIILARIGDVSLGTMRTVAVVSGHRTLAWFFGFLEVTIWVFVVSAVVTQIRSTPVYGVAYALGAATGSYVGVTMQRWLPFGSQVIRVFTRRGYELAGALRGDGFGVTAFEGEGFAGPVSMLFVRVRRTLSPRVVKLARTVDPQCFYTIDDIRVASSADSLARPVLRAP
jgi:uncharacterized protein YebE (UPF0316 family)